MDGSGDFRLSVLDELSPGEARYSSIADAWDDHDCCWDDDRCGYALAGAAVGAVVGYAAATPNYVTALPCAPTVVSVNGTSYYQCDSTWYNRTYVSGSLSYVVVDAPPGY